MSSSLLRRGVLVATAALLMLPGSAFAGRLIATGHDADLHCAYGSTGSCNYFDAAVRYVRATAPDPSKPVLVLDKGSLEAKRSLDMAGVPSVVMDPSSAEFASAVLVPSSYSAIVVASDTTCGGCDLNSYYGTADSDAINARTAAIDDFFNQGGGVLALSGASRGNGYSNVYYQFLPIPVGGTNVRPPFTVTAFGSTLGFTTPDANCCATHNSFSTPAPGSALKVAETDTNGNPETLVAEGTIVSGGDGGGGGVIVPPAPSDTTAPDVTPTVTGTTGDNGWYTSDVKVSWTVKDDESAITSPACADTTITSDTDGQTVTCTATSAGGTTTKSVTVKRDATAPAITADRTAANDAGWNNGDVTVTFHCTDGGSGVSSCSDAKTLSDEGASQSASGAVRDNAGNTASVTVDSINIDKTAPTITASVPAANANGWYRDSVTITWSCADSLSGPVASGDSATLSSEGKDQSATGNCADVAGNSSSDTQKGINIDKTPPVVSYSGNQGSYTVADTVKITCSATDALSGVDSSTCKDIAGDGFTFALGTNSYSASAKDLAGNTGSGSTSFKVGVDSDSLCTLTKRWVTNAGIANALCAKLDAAKASIARGDTNSKDGQLGAYRNQLSAQSGKSVAADKAAILTKLSQAL